MTCFEPLVEVTMALDCPRCREIKLEEIEVEEVLIDRCPRCGGLWFDHNEIRGILGRDSTVQQLDTIIPPSQDEVASMRCPRCASDVPLRKMTCRGDGAAVLLMYRCASCVGTWLDRGELRDAEDPRLADSMRSHLSQFFPRD